MPAGGHHQVKGEELTEQAGDQQSICRGGPWSVCLLLHEHCKPEAVNRIAEIYSYPLGGGGERQASGRGEKNPNVGTGDSYTKIGWTCEDSKHSSSHKRPWIA